MLKKPIVAILLATYNGERFLRQQLDSILAQTYQDFEIYISDDCSTDATLEIIKQYHSNFPDKVFFSVNDKNLGSVENFELLIKNCFAKYIAISDQDDVWKLDKLEKQMKYMLEHESLNSKNTPCLIHSDLQMIDQKNNVIKESFLKYRKIFLPEKKALNRIISHNGIMGCTILMNEALVKQILPFPEKLDVHDYWIAIVNEIIGTRITINEQLVLYRIHDNNVSNSIKKIQSQLNRNFFQRFFNDDRLPFVQLHREEVLEEVLTRFATQLRVIDQQVILSFIYYLTNSKNFLQIFYQLVKHDLIREDFSYRFKIFLKLVQRNLRKKIIKNSIKDSTRPHLRNKS